MVFSPGHVDRHGNTRSRALTFKRDIKRDIGDTGNRTQVRPERRADAEARAFYNRTRHTTNTIGHRARQVRCRFRLACVTAESGGDRDAWHVQYRKGDLQWDALEGLSPVTSAARRSLRAGVRRGRDSAGRRGRSGLQYLRFIYTQSTYCSYTVNYGDHSLLVLVW